MRARTGRFILSLFGWHVTTEKPDEIKKAVIIVAPHTSIWDFIIGFFGYMGLGIRAKYLIKKEFFRFPFGGILRSCGGIPVDRSKGANATNQVVDMLLKEDELIITITPEGSRNLVKNWKKGFYFIAHQAHVPILLGFVDYKNKHVGIGPLLETTGNYEMDFKIIENFYRQKTACHPENFNLSEQNRQQVTT